MGATLRPGDAMAARAVLLALAAAGAAHACVEPVRARRLATSAADCGRYLDIVYLLDESGSVGLANYRVAGKVRGLATRPGAAGP